VKNMSEVVAANQRNLEYYFGALGFRSNESNLYVTSNQCLRRLAKHYGKRSHLR
jgi:hypothetical protein